jgi:hypothetical protein
MSARNLARQVEIANYKQVIQQQKRYPGGFDDWNQFVTATNRSGRHINTYDFVQHNKRHAAVGNHPAHTTRIRPLVTYKSVNTEDKVCKYGTYKDGSTVKCLRSTKHAAKGVSHKKGAYKTGWPMGRPRGKNTKAPQLPKASVRRSARIAKK